MKTIDKNETTTTTHRVLHSDQMLMLGAVFGSQLGPNLIFTTVTTYRSGSSDIRVSHSDWSAEYEFNTADDRPESVIETIIRDQGVTLPRS